MSPINITYIELNIFWVGGIIQAVEHLPHKHEVLNSNSGATKKTTQQKKNKR
jgi:hypothetical protein